MSYCWMCVFYVSKSFLFISSGVLITMCCESAVLMCCELLITMCCESAVFSSDEFEMNFLLILYFNFIANQQSRKFSLRRSSRVAALPPGSIAGPQKLAGELNPGGEWSPGAEWCKGGEVDGLYPNEPSMAKLLPCFITYNDFS
jgi:hypothetical protein